MKTNFVAWKIFCPLKSAIARSVKLRANLEIGKLIRGKVAKSFRRRGPNYAAPINHIHYPRLLNGDRN